jgi:hypothetical protein
MIDPTPETQLLPGLVQRPPELGRIRMGEKSQAGHPVRLKTFRLTSASRPLLEAAASLYGGPVREWKGAPDEGMWELTTAAAELDILIPASFAVIGQRLELWQGGTLERGCDGTTESVSGQPCLCAAAGLEGADRECDIVTRLRVMLPRVPGLGMWRLDTSGYLAATTLPSTVQLLARLTPGQWIPAILRAEQRSSKTRLDSGKVETHRFVVPVIDLPGMTISQIVGGPAREAPALDEGTPAQAGPPTAADKAAQRRAELEAASTPAQAAQGPALPALPLPKGACPSRSPGGHECRLPFGHEGDHKAGAVAWQSPDRRQLDPVDEPDFNDELLDRPELRNVTPVDEIPADVQAGLDLLPPGTPMKGR